MIYQWNIFFIVMLVKFKSSWGNKKKIFHFLLCSIFVKRMLPFKANSDSVEILYHGHKSYLPNLYNKADVYSTFFPRPLNFCPKAETAQTSFHPFNYHFYISMMIFSNFSGLGIIFVHHIIRIKIFKHQWLLLLIMIWAAW